MDFRAFVEELELLVRSRYALIVIDTWEIDRATAAVRHVASRLSLHHHEWSRSRGMTRGVDAGAPLIEDTAAPIDALRHVEREGTGLFHFPLLGSYLDDPQVAAWVHEVVERFGARRGAVVISGRDVRLPESLRQYAIVVRLPAPSLDEYRSLLERVVREHTARMPVRVELTNESRARLLHNLLGLSLVEAERILTRLIMVDGALTEGDIPRIAVAKRQAVEQDGLLEYWPTTEGLAHVAGLAGLKTWLGKRRASVADPERASAFGLPFPKGILLTGVPGCGKSLSAKAVAHEWQLPLLRLDPGSLFNKYVGDTEKNFRRALATAERMAPIVLWIDELEKAFASTGDQDGGVSQRVLGGFLSWLQERRGDVFVVATCNDVTVLPAEFIRKGRFDEVFFVDLPNVDARRAVFEIHLRRRRQDLRALDVRALADATDGFSGAEIEQAIVSALFEAFARSCALSTDLVLAEVAATRPLSMTMAERLAALRAWASERTVDADGPAPVRAVA